MSRRELRRVEVMSRVQAGELQVVNAAEVVGVSYRQGKRVWGRDREEGPEGLKHGNAGRASKRGQPTALRGRGRRPEAADAGGGGGGWRWGGGPARGRAGG